MRLLPSPLFAKGACLALLLSLPSGLFGQIVGFEAAELGLFGDSPANLIGGGMNNHGHIVGSVSGLDNSPTLSFVYRDGSYTNLGTLTDGTPLYAYGINNAGQITGYGIARNALNQSTTAAFIYENGALSNVSIAVYSRGLAINDHGTIAGLVRLSPGDNFDSGLVIATNPTVHTPVDGLSTAGSTQLLAINNSGNAVGFSTSQDGSLRPVLYSNGMLTDLGTHGDTTGSEAIGINNSGTILIRSMITAGIDRKGFLFENGESVDIGSLGGGDTRPSDLNDHGYVVGYSRAADGTVRAFLYSKEAGMQDLETLFDDNTLVTAGYIQGSFRPFAINDNDWIAGIGRFTGDLGEHERLMLLTPVAIPEPETYALLILGILAAAAVRISKRR